ncbi:MAG TPA: hypothetical protein VG605_03270 [Puia sp.]|nr:hypothetical protein [Puia sp.]
MKTEVRLGSVVKHGVGGPEAGAINLIYSYLLHEHGQDFYKRIGINQIGGDLNEFVSKEAGNKIHVNIRYPVFDDFESRQPEEKNKIRLDVIHSSLMRIAEKDKRLSISQLELIKEKILENNFSFKIMCKLFVSTVSNDLVAKLIVYPEMNKFDYYVLIENQGKVVCDQWIYSGITDLIYFPELFSEGRWRGDKEFVITGKCREVEIRILIDDCKIEYKNLSPYDRPPYFEMMRADISSEEKEKADEDWKHSLPPAVAGITRRADN